MWRSVGGGVASDAIGDLSGTWDALAAPEGAFAAQQSSARLAAGIEQWAAGGVSGRWGAAAVRKVAVKSKSSGSGRRSKEADTDSRLEQKCGLWALVKGI